MMLMSGFDPGGGVDVDHPAAGDRVGDDLADGGLHLHVVPGAGAVGAGPAQLDGDGLEERQVVAEPQRLRGGHGEGERLGGDAGVVQEPVRQVHLGRAEQVLERRHDRLDLRPVRAGVERLAPRAAVQQLAEDLDLLLQQRERLVDRGADLLPGPVPVGVVGERGLQRLGDADVVDDQPAGLVAEGAVDPGDGLHQPGAAHRLVDVHGVHRRGVEAGQPHVPDDHQLQRVVRVLRPGLQLGSACLLRSVRASSGPSAAEPVITTLTLPVVVVAVPVRPQPHDRVVELGADPPGHAHDHRLAGQRAAAGFPVLDDVGGDLPMRFSAPTIAFDPRPPGLQPLPGVGLGELGDLLEPGVQHCPGFLRQLDLRQPGLVVHLTVAPSSTAWVRS